MSKGWESKNVEEQQAEAAAAKKPDGDPAAVRAIAEHKRRLQALELQREHVLSQRTSSPHRRSALEAALVEIELEIQKLGNTIHL